MREIVGMKSYIMGLMHYDSLVKTKDELVPPKPNEFDKTTSTCLSCACKGTKLKLAPTFGLCRFNVGGTTPYRGEGVLAWVVRK